MDTQLSTNRKFSRMSANILSIVVILAMAFPVTGSASALPDCNDPLGCVTISPSDPVHIAYALAISGTLSSLGIDERNGIEIAIDDSGGQILGHDVLLTGEDEACTPEGGATAGANLAADPTIVAVIGTTCSGAARNAMPLLSAAGFVMVSPSNTGPYLTDPGSSDNYPGYLRVSGNDRVQGTVAARFAREYLGISTAATIIDGNEYGTYLQQAFAEEFTNLGGSITAEVIIDPDQTDMSAELTGIAAGNPEMLYFPVFMPTGGDLVNQARATAGLESAYLMSGDGLWTEEIVNATGQNVEDLLVTNWDFTNNNPAYTDQFLPAYQAKFGTDPISAFHAYAYDAFMIIRAAIEHVAEVDQDGTIQIGRQELRDALYGTSGFPGLTGNLTCSATGDCAESRFAVYKFHADQFPPEYFWPQNSPPFGRDDFDGTLAEGWYWVNENADKWNLTESPGFLRIYASTLPAGGENLLLRPVAPGDFTIKTRVVFEPDTNFQFAGLVLWQDENNFLQFGRAFCAVEGHPSCPGNAIYFDKFLDGNFTDSNFATTIDNPSDVFLRLERRGDMVRALYSADYGISWYELGIHWIPPEFQVNGVGLTASQDFNTPDWDIPADFDFFELTEGWGFLPEGFHDYDSGDVPNWACNAGGWAADPDDRVADVNIEVVVDHQTVANLVAGDFRQDLLDAGVCVDGNCSFATSLWDLISSYETHKVDVWAQDDTGEWVLLSNSGKTLTCRSYDIYTFDPATGTTKQITNLPDTQEYNPRWSPDGKKIVHDVWNLDWSSHGVYITDVKTGASVPLSGAEGGSYPTWSPSGKWIAFDRGADNDNRLFIVSPAGGTPMLVAEDAFMAAWAPNGHRLAFHRPSDGSIRTVDLNGANETTVVENGNGPAWSPDGEWIAFERDGDVWKINVDNRGIPLGDPVQLTSSPSWEGRPTWSNNSKTIAFHAGMTGDTDIWTVPASGGTAMWLTGAPNFGDYDPNYSFNGRYVAYSSFSPDGQAARQWGAAYTSEMMAWAEGSHSYYLESSYSVPEPGGGETADPINFTVSSDAPWYDGSVLLRFLALRARSGDECPAIDPLIRPDQNTLFHYGWVTETPMTYQEAVAHFDTLTVTAYWDDAMSAQLMRHEIFPWSSVDWNQYVCSAAGP